MLRLIGVSISLPDPLLLWKIVDNFGKNGENHRRFGDKTMSGAT